MALTVRSTHRDLAYFFLGLIIAFSFSGIFLNHRQDFNPRRYTVTELEFSIEGPVVKEDVTEAFISAFTSERQIDDDLRRFSVDDKNVLRISYTNNDVQVDLATGKGKITTYRMRPLLGQMTQLHIDTSKWWIYYSDVFGLAMLTIAFTGMFIEKGRNSFRQRGWWLALLGVIFPLIFLFLLS